MPNRRRWTRAIACGATILAGAGYLIGQLASGPPKTSNSSPIAVTPDDRYVWVANPEKNTVTEFAVGGDQNRKVVELAVGEEPTHVAIAPSGRWIWVANTVSGTVSVIDAVDPNSPTVFENITVGTEPYGMSITPNGKYVYVANSRSNDVTVIEAATYRIITTIKDVGPEPRGIAITNDGDEDDNDEKVYVTQFLATDRRGVLIGADNYKEGRVTVLSTETHSKVNEIALAPLDDTGFRSNGSALERKAAATPPAFDHVTGAFPNQLLGIALYGNKAYLPNTGASPDGPVRFNVNVQALVSVIDIEKDEEAAAADGKKLTMNMNRGINFEAAGPNKIFPSSPWAVAFKRSRREGYVVSAASNILVKLVLDDKGAPSINAPVAANDPGGIVRIPVGQNPRGLAINSRDDRAYVANEVSRDVTVVNLTNDSVLATMRATEWPKPGSDEARILLGKAMFNTSRGVNMPELGPEFVVADRMSSEGWSSCFACHPNGLTDGVVWIFGAGPRFTLPMHSTFSPKDPNDQKILNHSAIFDEVQDFENNIRGTSGGLGLFTRPDGSQDPLLDAFVTKNTGRSVQFDALAFYTAMGIRAPISPARGLDPDSPQAKDIVAGRELFAKAGCDNCHAGRGWSSTRVFLPNPPPASEVVRGQILRYLRKVGTFDDKQRNEIRQNGAAPLGADGYVPTSLLSVFAFAPYLHDGSALSLENVLENVTHRSAGSGGTDTLKDSRDRAAVIEFLKSIDVNTPAFDVK